MRQLVIAFLASSVILTGMGPGTARLSAQERNESIGGPLTWTPVLNAPFTADMTVTISQAGKVKKATARYFRDSQGRVRIDYQAPTPDGPDIPMAIVSSPEADRHSANTLDLKAKTFSPFPVDLGRMIFNGGASVSVPIAPTQFREYVAADYADAVMRTAIGGGEPLGTQTIGGVTTTGRRVSENDERWESSELKLVIYSHRIDAKTGADIDYRLTNITRTEPSPELFVVPDDYAPVLRGSKDNPLFGVTWKD